MRLIVGARGGDIFQRPPQVDGVETELSKRVLMVSMTLIFAFSLTTKIEKIDNCKGEQRDQKPSPIGISLGPKFSIQIRLAGRPH
jgi:hypothetical protein